MPAPNMNKQEQAAYDTALRRIQRCLRVEQLGTSLDLADLGLTILPPEIGQLKALKRLQLRKNRLATLPREIGQLATLKELSLAYNQVTRLPLEIGQLTALEDLLLANNQLMT